MGLISGLAIHFTIYLICNSLLFDKVTQFWVSQSRLIQVSFYAGPLKGSLPLSKIAVTREWRGWPVLPGNSAAIARPLAFLIIDLHALLRTACIFQANQAVLFVPDPAGRLLFSCSISFSEIKFHFIAMGTWKLNLKLIFLSYCTDYISIY